MKRKFLLGKAEKVQSAELSRTFHIPNKNYGILLFQTLLLENFFSFLTFSSPLFLIFWVAKENPKNAIFSFLSRTQLHQYLLRLPSASDPLHVPKRISLFLSLPSPVPKTAKIVTALRAQAA
jgi:hypothetical protein